MSPSEKTRSFKRRLQALVVHRFDRSDPNRNRDRFLSSMAPGKTAQTLLPNLASTVTLRLRY
ncbi:MAG: hypothetical protein PHG55_11690, partial [Verrucomicrobiota bacterium]|nr:hypothetical protein [Verrucomicrobiota bacterium]